MLASPPQMQQINQTVVSQTSAVETQVLDPLH